MARIWAAILVITVGLLVSSYIRTVQAQIGPWTMGLEQGSVYISNAIIGSRTTWTVRYYPLSAGPRFNEDKGHWARRLAPVRVVTFSWGHALAISLWAVAVLCVIGGVWSEMRKHIRKRLNAESDAMHAGQSG